MPMKGRFAVRRTLRYLSQGDLVFKSAVKVMTVNYNSGRDSAARAGRGPRRHSAPARNVLSSFLPSRKFVFFNIPQIQYKNPWVQIMLFRNMTPSPFLRFYLDNGEQVLVDVEDKNNKEITEHIKKILGKSRETLEKEERERKKLSHPATFGPRKYHLRECMCEIEGQVPCPAFVPLPKEMRGKYKAALKNEA
ncbi:RT25 protein, partial [Sakesphorus luctuosus]|nr:RT25 protein [Sakesphorus luctuosus]